MKTAFNAKPLFRPRLLEIFTRPYGRSDLLADVMAGITVRLIALPLALALGVASIPPGTQTSYPPSAVGLFLLITEKYGYSSLILATLMAGGILVVMGLARMGTLIKFIPWPVTNGFTTGIAVSIMAKVSSFIGSLAHSSLARRKRWRMPCNGLASCRECSFCDCIW